MPKPLLTNNSWFKNVFGDFECVSWDSYIYSKWFNYLEIELIMTPNLQREAVYVQSMHTPSLILCMCNKVATPTCGLLNFPSNQERLR